jgi:predicted O-methyltransferase YrrM
MRRTLRVALVGLGVLAIASCSRAEDGDKDEGRKRPEPDVSRVQPVIDEVEKLCLEKTVFMIGRRKAERLAELVRENRPRTVLECGTAIGYSGLWIARELKRAGRGHLVTMEISASRARQAEAFFRKAGLADFVTVRTGDATKLTKELAGPIDFAFIDCGYSNYHPILANLKGKLAPDAVLVADNVGLGARGLRRYLEAVRRFDSRTEWFDVDLPWAKRDGMEVTVMRKERAPFLGWPHDKARKIAETAPESAVRDIEDLSAVRTSSHEEYERRKRAGQVAVESFRDGWVYYAVNDERDVPFAPTEGGPVSAWVPVIERYRARPPAAR